MLTESALIAILGGALGATIAGYGTSLLATYGPAMSVNTPILIGGRCALARPISAAVASPEPSVARRVMVAFMVRSPLYFWVSPGDEDASLDQRVDLGS